MTTTRPLRRAAFAAATAGLALTGVPAASAAPTVAEASAVVAPAGTLVFVKDSNVWVSRTDGRDARRITRDGTASQPYLSPSQADTGVVVASHAGRIVRMDAFGHALNVIDPPGLVSSAGGVMDGTPSSVAISPDGALIAYTQVESGCPVVVSCDTRFATAYTAASGLTDPATYGVTYGNDPSWLGDDRTVQGGGAIPDVRVHVLGQPSPPRWFTDSQIEANGQELTDPTVSPDGAWVAAVRDTLPHTNLLWAKTGGSLTAPPSLWCFTDPDPVAEPAFSADSTTLAWTVGGQGIFMESDLEGCGKPALVVPGGSEADFSAASFTTVDPYVPPAGPAAPAALTPAVAAPQLGAAPAITGRARVGKRLRASTGTWTAVSTYAFAWLRDGTAIRAAGGPTYKPTAKDRGKRISVRVIATGPGGTATATSAPVKVKR